MADKKNSLEKYKVEYRHDKEKFRVSSTFGKKDPLLVRLASAAAWAVLEFIANIIGATKQIVKEIL